MMCFSDMRSDHIEIETNKESIGPIAPKMPNLNDSQQPELKSNKKGSHKPTISLQLEPT